MKLTEGWISRAVRPLSPLFHHHIFRAKQFFQRGAVEIRTDGIILRSAQRALFIRQAQRHGDGTRRERKQGKCAIEAGAVEL